MFNTYAYGVVPFGGTEITQPGKRLTPEEAGERILNKIKKFTKEIKSGDRMGAMQKLKQDYERLPTDMDSVTEMVDDMGTLEYPGIYDYEDLIRKYHLDRIYPDYEELYYGFWDPSIASRNLEGFDEGGASSELINKHKDNPYVNCRRKWGKRGLNCGELNFQYDRNNKSCQKISRGPRLSSHPQVEQEEVIFPSRRKRPIILEEEKTKKKERRQRNTIL